MFANPVVGALLGFGPAALVVGGSRSPSCGPVSAGGASRSGLVAATAGFVVAPVAVRGARRLDPPALGPPPALRVGPRGSGTRHASATSVRLLALGGLTIVSARCTPPSCSWSWRLFAVGLVILLPSAAQHVRWHTNLRRRLARDWSGVPVEEPYRPEPQLPPRRPDGLYQVDKHLFKTPQWTRYNQRMDWAWHDPATWRDILWLLLDPIAGGAIIAGSVGAVVFGLLAQVVPAIRELVGDDAVHGPVVLHGQPWLALVLGVALIVLGFVVAPSALRLHGRWTAWLLAPTEKARLDLRVRQLTESRADAIDAQAAELRRIERDLHDGAQARLVAVGLTPRRDRAADGHGPGGGPQAARPGPGVVRDGADRAARPGPRHPPAGAGRARPRRRRPRAGPGRPAAGRRSTVDLPAGRAPAPVESAAYFAVSEALANAARHAGARRVAIDAVDHDGRALTVTVTRRRPRRRRPVARHRPARHAAPARVPSTVRCPCSSPPGGPTVVTMEVPCALSSPRTSTS